MTKVLRARVRDDERTLELVERLAGAAGLEVNVTLTGLPEEPLDRPPVPTTVSVWPDLGFRGPFPLTRREIYEDV